ncbi:MAG: stage II sporulation protein D [Acutalibacteraceae bacterium]|nr:stage II sporulation protein D [Clostridia bacterium]MEE1330608.1 stage II sporulation protein D [Acutalibacteraceae bacterium]
MKKIFCCALIILSVMLVLPLAALESPKETAVETAAHIFEMPKAGKAVSETFRICDTSNDTVTEMKAADYIFGVVAAEMPALYEKEALKAQAVAAYTYACVKKVENADKTYDLTTDPSLDQSFITREEAEKRWGDKAGEYREKIETAVKETEGYMITYEKKPILAVYHAISTGMTESCENVWGKDIPYLKPVASPGDKLAPEYIKKAEFTEEEVKTKLAELCTVSGEAKDFFTDIQKTESGTVKSLSVCGKEVTGAAIRSLFNLRSSAFEVAYDSGKFTFTVYGYGHGVGMSQYGANYMAKQGSDFKEILCCYYSGCKVEKVS